MLVLECDNKPDMNRVAELADSVRQMGLGRVLVLVGPSAERKTLVLALVLEVRYYLIDLGAVVSKYIGETEKNLAQLMASADNPAGVLFFDEADSLFGPRTGVRGARDRYTDLLPALRSTRGLVVLGVNDPERLPRDLRERAQVVATRDYWPPR